VRESKVLCLVLFLSEPKNCILVSRSLGVLETHRTSKFSTLRVGVERRGRSCTEDVETPHLSWRSSLVKSGIKVTGKLGVSLSGQTFVASRQGCPERDLVAGKQYLSEWFNNMD
jgi:hypothetical protein